MESAAWPGTEATELWDVCSHVFTETMHRTYVYKASDLGAAARPPSMQVTIEDVQAQGGSTAEFQAVIEGDPQPTVTWYKDSVQLVDSARLSQQQEGTTYSLVLRDVAQHDAGVYTCLAQNAGGQVLCKAELLVHGGASELGSEKQSYRRKLHSFYEVKEEIGRGVFGFVKRVQHKGNQMSCAAKFIPLRSRTRTQAYRERDVLAELSHPLVTRLLDQFETRKTLILVLELCSSEELLDRLFKKSVVTEAEVKVYIQQLAEGLHYLHSHSILHLDIKPPNILMVHPAREDIKICDFGFAQRITLAEPKYSKYGCPEFVSPEVIEQTPVSEASDIWAMGVISYLSLTCVSPFAGESDRATLLNVLEGRVSWSSPVAAHLSPDAQDFIKAALRRVPESRPSAAQCLAHPWFQKSLPAEEAHFINTKQLKFLLARSRWQRGPATRKGSDPPEAVAPQAPGSFLSRGLQAPSSPAQASLQPGSKMGLEATLFPGKPRPPSSPGPASPSGMAPGSSLDTEDLAQETEGLWESEPSPPQPREQATSRKFSLGHHGGYAGVAGYGAFAFGGDAGGILGQGPLWARMTWATSQSLEEQDETGAESPLPQASVVPLPEGSGGRGSQVSLVQIQDLSGDMEAADTMSLDISEVEPAYLNLSDLYDIKYLPFEFMLFRKIPKPELPPSPASEAREELAELPEATWSWQGGLGLPASLEIREELEDSEALFREAGGSRKRKWSPPSSGRRFPGRHALLDEPVELGLRQKVRASVAHISSLLRGRPQGPEKEGPPRKKAGLVSFRLSGLKSRDQAPSFLRELADETVVLGQSVTLACQVSAQPAAQATWEKDGVILESSSRLLISSTLKNFHLLTILVVTTEDLGVYTCSVHNALGTAATTAVLRKAERPSSSPRPDIGEVYTDGVLLVWKPMESYGPVTYIVQCSLEGGSWSTLASDIFDCCYLASKLSRGGVYAFRTACVSKAGMGPYSSPSEQVHLGGPRHLASEESCPAPPAQPLPSTQTFAFQTQIRRGRFSVVRQCREKASGRELAAKIIPYRPEDRTAVLSEYEALKGLRNPHLAQLQAAYLSPRHLVLILELCSGPELLPCLAERASYSESEVKDYLWQMLSATQYLHAQRILHLDLRSENMIVTEYNLLKVVDLGNAQSLAQERVLPSERFKDYVETMAPELLEGQGAVPQTDIWAIGVTAFIMLSAEYPVSSEGTRDMQKGLRKGLILLSRCYAGLSGGAVAFLQSTLCAHPWGRPCASSCLQCPWLTEEGPACSQPSAVTFPTARLRAFVREREKRRALLYKKHNLAQVC
ncbi:Obscurin [Myotis brandtii]|uniref:Obscurin n=1 Tax=Myotis brandtii TaxID=109478 RepID=S7MU88_MYOBR|nr:Obscurin [Myotis brandtii]